jgi:cytochrome c biogenesis protein CcmG, thiol:disulfide interchange protein DsbE
VSAPPRSVPAWSLALPVAVVLLATTAAVGFVILNASPKMPTVAKGFAAVGARAPDFSSWDLNGHRVSLSDFRGKPVLLTFWATWCTACHDELPALQRIADTYKGNGLTVLAVDYRETDDARMTQYLASLGVHLEGVIDPQGSIASAYGVDIGLPVNVWLDRNMAVSLIITGAVPDTTLRSAAMRLVGVTG